MKRDNCQSRRPFFFFPVRGEAGRKGLIRHLRVAGEAPKEITEDLHVVI